MSHLSLYACAAGNVLPQLDLVAAEFAFVCAIIRLTQSQLLLEEKERCRIYLHVCKEQQLWVPGGVSARCITKQHPCSGLASDSRPFPSPRATPNNA